MWYAKRRMFSNPCYNPTSRTNFLMSMTSPLLITAHNLREWATCHRLMWLNRYGDFALRSDPTTRSLYAQAIGREFEARLLQTADPDTRVVPIADWDEGVTLTRTWMQQGVRVIHQAILETELTINGIPVKLRGKVDRLVRSRMSKLYEPIELKSAHRATDLDRLQLDFYMLLLTLIQGREPLRAQLWLNDDGDEPLVQDHDYDPDRIAMLLEAMVATLCQPNDSPPVVLLPHCKECRWFSQCKQHDSARYDIGQLGLKATIVDELRLKGIHTLGQFADIPEQELRSVKGIKSSALRLQAQALAFIEGRPMRFAPLNDVVRQPAAMFDIETNPVNPSRTWSLGVGTDINDVTVIIVAPRRISGARLMADGNRVVYVPNHDELWRTFAEYVEGVPRAFHWSGFDAQVMRRTAPPEIVPRLNPLMDDLLAHTKRTTAFPLNSLSLKVLGPYCGYQWSAYDTWDAAWLDYNKWLRDDDEDALMRACAYQRDDVKAMFVVRDVLLGWG